MTRKITLLLICMCLTPVISFADVDDCYYDDDGNCMDEPETNDNLDDLDVLINQAIRKCALGYDDDACDQHKKLEKIKRQQKTQEKQRMAEQLARKAQQKRVKIDLVVKEHGNFSAYTINDRGGRRKVWGITAHDDQDVYSFNSSGFTIRKGDKYEVYVCKCNQLYCDCRENWRW